MLNSKPFCLLVVIVIDLLKADVITLPLIHLIIYWSVTSILFWPNLQKIMPCFSIYPGYYTVTV